MEAVRYYAAAAPGYPLAAFVGLLAAPPPPPLRRAVAAAALSGWGKVPAQASGSVLLLATVELLGWPASGLDTGEARVCRMAATALRHAGGRPQAALAAWCSEPLPDTVLLLSAALACAAGHPDAARRVAARLAV